MPRYDTSHYDPPAPVAIVTLRDSASTNSVADVSLLIDTGADVTLLPRAPIARLGVTPQANQCELIGFDGQRSPADVVELDMIFLRKVFRGRYLLIDSPHGVLGRDVLSALKLTFDGPGQEWAQSS